MGEANRFLRYQNEYEYKMSAFGRGIVKELLNQCSQNEKEFFNRMYGSIDKLPLEKMRHAYSQCKNTLEGKKELTK